MQQPRRRLLLLLPLLLMAASISPCLSLAPVSRTVTVDQRGGGDFTSVQSAVDSVPDGNLQWIRIHVKAGTYREKVIIPKEKSYILLQGDGSWNTEITSNGHALSGISILSGSSIDEHFKMDGHSATFNTSTFIVLADDFIARGISFRNMYNAYSKSSPHQAVAALVGGDRSAFYDCDFYGFQDTLCDFTGRHYFHRCSIKGGIDFIFGYGQSIYDNCTLLSNMPPRTKLQPGWVTAHRRITADSPGGLVFKGGSLQGTGRVFLGRAWNEFATVVFYQVSMAEIVVPQGWQAWDSPGVSSITFAEVGCEGPGANKAGRVPWEKNLSDEQVQSFVDLSFIDKEGWISNQPCQNTQENAAAVLHLEAAPHLAAPAIDAHLRVDSGGRDHHRRRTNVEEGISGRCRRRRGGGLRAPDGNREWIRIHAKAARKLQEVAPECVCDALLRLPPFLVKPQHKYTVRVGRSCKFTYRCGGY
ncbi:hypothetical protein ABZP36_000368 [Zizania latifolia]